MLEPASQVLSTEINRGETVKKSQLITDAEYQKQKIETRVDLDMPNLNSVQGRLLLTQALTYTLTTLEIKQKQLADEAEKIPDINVREAKKQTVDTDAIQSTQDQVANTSTFVDLVYSFSRLERSNKLDGLVLDLDERIDPHQTGKMLVSEDTDVKESINKRAEYIVQQGYLTTKDDAVLLLQSIYKASLYRLVGSTLLMDLEKFTIKKPQIPDMIATLKAGAQPTA